MDCLWVFFFIFLIGIKLGGVFAMKKQKNMLFFAMSFLSLQILSAQAMTVSGTVSDAQTGEALLGAQVFVKGTFVGTTTDDNGAFSLDVETGATLVVNYIGYKSQEVGVSEGQALLSVQLEPDVLKQDEVVVTGLASSVKRRNLATAVAKVSGEELNGSPSQSLDQALGGKFAGVHIRRNTGAPGGGMSVNLRGVATIAGETQPLYVVDGIIVNNFANQSGIDVVSAATGAGSARPQGQPTNRIADINPSDIESVEVLKGASAAAIYGAKASNGVVIITTKRGMSGKTKVNVSQRFGSRSIINKQGFRVFETYQEAEDQYGPDVAALGNDAAGNWANRKIDYEDVLYGETGNLKETSLSVTGGDQSTQFFLSGQYLDEGDIIINRGYKRVSGRANVDHRVNDKLKVATTAYLANTFSDRGITGNDNSGKSFNFAIAATPSFIDIRQNSDGTWPIHPTNASNPLHEAAVLTNEETVNRAMGSTRLDYNLVRNSDMSLDLIGTLSADYVGQENTVFSPPELQDEQLKSNPGSSVLSNHNSLNTNASFNLAHRMSLGGMKLNTTAGYQAETLDYNNSMIIASGMVVTQTNIDQSAATSALQTRRKQQDRGWFVQEEVAVGDNIHVSLGVRSDRSSTLGDTEKSHMYPKFAASYRTGEIAVFDDLKVRTSYGVTGNMPKPFAKYTAMSPSNIGGMSGLVTSGLKGLDDIAPEEMAELEYGVDGSIMNGLLGFEFTLYNQNITGLLLEVEEAPSTGYTNKWANAGDMETKGMELDLVLNPVRTKDLNWVSRLSYYTTSSEITRLDVDPYNTGGFATFLGAYRIEKGWSPHTMVGAEKDANDVHIVLGNETPDFVMGLNNRVQFGAFSLVAHIDIKQGGDIVNLQKLIADLGGTTYDYDDQTLDLNDDGAKDGNGPERLTVLGAVTAPYIEDGSYVRLSELSFNWDVPKSLLAGRVSSMQVGVSARDFWLSTDYSGWNPDVSQFGNVAVGGSVDTGPYPMSKALYFNVSVGL